MEFLLSPEDLEIMKRSYMQGTQMKNNESWIKAFQYYNKMHTEPKEKLPITISANYVHVLRYCNEQAKVEDEKFRQRYEVACVATGQEGNISLHPIFNSGQVIGYIFLAREVTDDLNAWNINVVVDCKKKPTGLTGL